jgi:hypothetical protein
MQGAAMQCGFYKVLLELKERKLVEGWFVDSSLICAASFDRIFMSEHGEPLKWVEFFWNTSNVCDHFVGSSPPVCAPGSVGMVKKSAVHLALLDISQLL